MKEERSQNVTNQSETKNRGLFYGVIAVAVFIIMAVGTTFAYFTATTNSADSSVQTGSTTLRLKYISYEGAWLNKDLIPANTDVVEYSFEYQSDTTVNTAKENYDSIRYNALCKDDFGNSICSVYVFQVQNSANSPQAVSIDVLTQTNGFGSLHAMAYEISEPTDTESEDYKSYFPVVNEETQESTFTNALNGLGDPTFKTVNNEEDDGTIAVRDGDGNFMTSGSYSPVYVNRTGVLKKLLKWNNSGAMEPSIDRPIKILNDMNLEDRSVRVADNIELPERSTKTFALVLYIKNDENKDQTDSDADKTFTGQVIVGPGDGSGGVSGQIEAAAAAKDQMQSVQGSNEEEEADDETGV